MKRRILPPYLQWRDGRPRWEPGPRLRPAWRGQDLKTDAGEWLGLEAAIARAKALNNEVAAAKAGAPRPRQVKLNRKPARTCQALFELWASPGDPAKASPRWQQLAPVTRRDYTSKINIFLADFGDDPVAALSKSHLHSWWEDLYRDRGHAMANGVLACVRAMLSYAVLKDWRSDNPAKSLGLIHVPPRVVVFDKLFLDLRDTAVTRLALAGCTVTEIRAITGHSLETVHKVLAHYLALDDRMADAAIDRLRDWMDREGIRL